MNQVYVEVSLLRHLYEHDLWHKVDDLWQARLMPWGALVRQKGGAGFEPCFVVKTFENAILTWPAEQVEVNLWRPRLDCKALDTRVIFDVEEWEAGPTIAVSPKRLWLEDINDLGGTHFHMF